MLYIKMGNFLYIFVKVNNQSVYKLFYFSI